MVRVLECRYYHLVVTSVYVAVIGSQDLQWCKTGGFVSVEIDIVPFWVATACKLAGGSDWPATLIPSFCIMSYFLTMTQLQSKYDVLFFPQSW